jgi:hypothetical protein
MTTFTTEDRIALERKEKKPMSFADIQELFNITLSTTDPNYNPAKVIEFVRKVEKFHNIG